MFFKRDLLKAIVRNAHFPFIVILGPTLQFQNHALQGYTTTNIFRHGFAVN